MFETAELGQIIDHETYQTHAPEVRQALLLAQQAMREAKFPVIVVFAGIEKAGVGDTLNLLNAWMDPRGIRTEGFALREQPHAEDPPFWQYWAVLPARGQIGLFDGAWYHRPLCEFVDQVLDAAAFDRELAEINAFEKMLADDGALVLKFWLHLGERQQRKALEALQADPDRAWRVAPSDWLELERHGQVSSAAEHLIARTSTPEAPWFIVEGTDPRYRALRVGMLLRHALQRRLEVNGSSPPESAVEPVAALLPRSILSTVDLSQSIEKDAYREALPRAQGRVARLQREANERGLSTVMVFEGWDAAGKGGVIRRLTQALDAREYAVFPVRGPTEEERSQHYLWRFWKRLPPAGCISIFDRSWFGRVLVERVEELASPEAWRRAYAEINTFERALAAHGVVIVKLWLHVSHDEQERRFRNRAETPHKRWKLTDEDWRNRERWNEYEAAVHDMVERTSTRVAPWHLISAEDKRHARLEVLRILADALEAALDDQPEVALDDPLGGDED